MSFKAVIWAGHFDPEQIGLPIPSEPIAESTFAAILARFADRDAAGERIVPPRRERTPDGSKVLLGFIGKEFVIYHRAGFLEMVFGGVEPRIDAFLATLCRELGCRLLNANSWEWVTDIYLRSADPL